MGRVPYQEAVTLWTPETPQIEFMLAEAELTLLYAQIRAKKLEGRTPIRMAVGSRAAAPLYA